MERFQTEQVQPCWQCLVAYALRQLILVESKLALESIEANLRKQD